MATASKTVSWAFATRITTLATNTTLATATRHDFAAITIDMPELTRTIRSVKLRVTARDAFTAITIYRFQGWRLGIKLGAVAFDDLDYSPAIAFGQSEHETLIVERDVTAYFVTNFGAGASQTCQVGVAFQTQTASNVNCITAELYVTYDYSNTAATQLRCIEIPIQGHHTSIDTSDVEIGTTAGVSNAPANQIPILDGSGTFCPEAGKVFKAIYLRVTAIDNVGAAATNFNLSVKLDAGTYDARATIEQSLISAAPYRDLIDLMVAPYSITTSAAHALVMKSSLTATFENISVVLVVVYTFTLSGTTREQHSVRAPLDNDRSALDPVMTGFDDRYTVVLDVQEPGTITLQQSGLVIYDQMTNAVSSNSQINCTGQAVRSMVHTGTGAGAFRSAPSVWVRRCDHDSSAWTLVRGVNRLTVNCKVSVYAIVTELNGYAIINYTADVPAMGLGSGNRSCAYSLVSATGGSGTGTILTEERLPSVPTTPWRLSGAWLDIGGRTGSANALVYKAQRKTGEDSGAGWYTKVCTGNSFILIGRKERILPVTDWARQSSFSTLGMDIFATRQWHIAHGNASVEWCATTWIALHGISFTVAGTVLIRGVPAANGGAVRIYADDGAGAIEYITSVTIAGGAGAFTVEVCDSTRNYFCTYNVGGEKGWSGFGTPGTSTFNIAVGLTVGLAFASRKRIPMQTIKLSTAEDVRFTMRDSTTGALLAGLTVFVVSLCKKGGTSHSVITPTITDLGGGLYNLALTTTHTNTENWARVMMCAV